MMLRDVAIPVEKQNGIHQLTLVLNNEKYQGQFLFLPNTFDFLNNEIWIDDASFDAIYNCLREHKENTKQSHIFAGIFVCDLFTDVLFVNKQNQLSCFPLDNSSITINSPRKSLYLTANDLVVTQH